jgi:hypothetical protein
MRDHLPRAWYLAGLAQVRMIGQPGCRLAEKRIHARRGGCRWRCNRGFQDGLAGPMPPSELSRFGL